GMPLVTSAAACRTATWPRKSVDGGNQDTGGNWREPGSFKVLFLVPRLCPVRKAIREVESVNKNDYYARARRAGEGALTGASGSCGAASQITPPPGPSRPPTALPASGTPAAPACYRCRRPATR